ncbi:helix-turn-helix domain-containing protein [Enterococcus faecalis]
MDEEQVKAFANLEAQRIIDQIISLRKEKGLSQEKLAEKSGISRNTIIQVERKKVKISLVTFCALLKGLEASYSDFFKVTQEESDLADEFGDELVGIMKKLSVHSNKNEYIAILKVLLSIN